MPPLLRSHLMSLIYNMSNYCCTRVKKINCFNFQNYFFEMYFLQYNHTNTNIYSICLQVRSCSRAFFKRISKGTVSLVYIIVEKKLTFGNENEISSIFLISIICNCANLAQQKPFRSLRYETSVNTANRLYKCSSNSTKKCNICCIYFRLHP